MLEEKQLVLVKTVKTRKKGKCRKREDTVSIGKQAEVLTEIENKVDHTFSICFPLRKKTTQT